MPLDPNDFWTAANAITALAVGIFTVVVMIALHRRSRHKQITIILEKAKSVFAGVTLRDESIKLKVGSKEVDALSAQRLQIGNTGHNSISDVSVKIFPPSNGKFFTVVVDEDGIIPDNILLVSDGEIDFTELHFAFLNAREVCVINTFFEGEPEDCSVAHRQPDVQSRIVKAKSPTEALETTFGILATYGAGGATGLLIAAMRALVR